MGGAQSARRISINNDSESAIITVSESVIDRLKGGSSVPRPTPVLTAASGDSQKKAELEDEMKKNSEYWEKRLNKIQEAHDVMSKEIENEYMRTVKELEKVLPKLSSEGDPPCQGLKSAVAECYKKNPDQALLCAQEVEDFANCMADNCKRPERVKC